MLKFLATLISMQHNEDYKYENNFSEFYLRKNWKTMFLAETKKEPYKNGSSLFYKLEKYHCD